MSKLSEVVENYMEKTSGLKKFCDRCLRTERYDSNVVLIIIDASFDSMGLNYFNAIVPNVLEFKEELVDSGEVETLEDLSKLSFDKMKKIWKSKRSWNIATSTSNYINKLGERENLNDKQAFRKWASRSKLENWRENPIGSIRGVGITTYQYLRMMGGVDTAMPDKIVRRVIEEILEKADESMLTDDDTKFVKTVDRIASLTGYRAIDLCWMTWLVQYESDEMRMDKYQSLLNKI